MVPWAGSLKDEEADPAVEVVRALQAKYPGSDTAIVADTALYGANAKISNLINMLPTARHDTLVLSDSDIAVGPKWLAQVTAALARPNVGIVTCLYTGEPAKDGHRLWSSLAAMGTSYTFLPNAVLGASLGLATDPDLGFHGDDVRHIDCLRRFCADGGPGSWHHVGHARWGARVVSVPAPGIGNAGALARRGPDHNGTAYDRRPLGCYPNGAPRVR